LERTVALAAMDPSSHRRLRPNKRGGGRRHLQRHLAGIGDTLATIFTIADENTITTLAAAGRIGSERLARANASEPA
jgi:hypothetical protein